MVLLLLLQSPLFTFLNRNSTCAWFAFLIKIKLKDKNSSTALLKKLAFFIIHVNDHEPILEKSEYSAGLSELVPVGSYVAGIIASDKDTGIQSNIIYAMSGNE